MIFSTILKLLLLLLFDINLLNLHAYYGSNATIKCFSHIQPILNETILEN
jgi:hypothetical protein